MSSKNFGKGINAILMSSRQGLNASLSGSNKSDQGSTLIVLEKDLYQKVKSIAYWNRTTFKKVVEDILAQYFNDFDPITLQKALKGYRSILNDPKPIRYGTKKSECENVRTNVSMEKSLLEKVKALAYWERIALKQLFEEVLEKHFSSLDQQELRTALLAYESSLKKEMT